MNRWAEVTDARLVEAARADEPAAYGEIVRRYQAHVYAVAYNFVGNWADAQDVTQEVFIRAHGNLAQLRQPERFAAWLRQISYGVAP